MHVDTNLGCGKPQKLGSESVFSVLALIVEKH